MKKIILATSAALLIAAPGLSLAQDDHHREGGGHPGGVAPQFHPPSAPPSHPSAPLPAAPQFRGAPRGAPGYHPSFAGQSGGGYRPQPGFAGQPQPAYRPQGFVSAQPYGGYRGGYPGAGRAGGQPFGFSGRQYFRYRAAPYHFPAGYYGWASHGWRRGEWLPPIFITSSYFINDWYDFGLWQPGYGYEWIRVGADAVLVNLADGQVVDVVPGVYYD